MSISSACPKGKSDQIATMTEPTPWGQELLEELKPKIRHLRAVKRMGGGHARKSAKTELPKLEQRWAALKRQVMFTRYICVECGYTEQHLEDPSLIANDKEMQKLVRWQGPGEK